MSEEQQSEIRTDEISVLVRELFDESFVDLPVFRLATSVVAFTAHQSSHAAQVVPGETRVTMVLPNVPSSEVLRDVVPSNDLEHYIQSYQQLSETGVVCENTQLAQMCLDVAGNASPKQMIFFKEAYPHIAVFSGLRKRLSEIEAGYDCKLSSYQETGASSGGDRCRQIVLFSNKFKREVVIEIRDN